MMSKLPDYKHVGALPTPSGDRLTWQFHLNLCMCQTSIKYNIETWR